MTEGRFILIEGVDGCGKSTHTSLLVDWLKNKGIDVLRTKEPSKGKIGLLLRDYLKEDALPLIDALLFTADRAEHIEKEIKPALESGKTIVCERYYYSTIAYQKSQGLEESWLKELNSFAVEPDLVILLDLNPEEAVKRTTTEEKFENLEFLKKVQQNYLDLAQKYSFKIIDAGKEKEVVQEEIQKAVSEKFNI